MWGALTPLSRSQTLLQLHALELQGIQLPLNVLHLPLDLRRHVVGVQLGMSGWCQGCQVPFRTSRRIVGLLLRRCRGQGPHLGMTGEPRGVSRVVAGFSNQPSLVAKVEIRFGGISGNEKTAGRGVGLESSPMRNRLARAPLCSRSPFSQRAAGEEGVREPHRLGPGAAQPDAEACREPAPYGAPTAATPGAPLRAAF